MPRALKYLQVQKPRTFLPLIVLAMTGVSACGNADVPKESPSFGTVKQASVMGEAEIMRKWEVLGAAVVGQPTGPFESVDGFVEFRQFDNGAIVWSSAYGTAFLPTAIFQKWRGLVFSQYGSENRLLYTGRPRGDVKHIGAIDEVTFERGLITSRNGNVFAVIGSFFDRYQGLKNSLGFPTSDEVPIGPQPGFKQSFANGELFWKSGSHVPQMVLESLRAKWEAQGGLDVLGFPTADTAIIASEGGLVLGRVGFFEHGDLYDGENTGPRVLRGTIGAAYRESYGGPKGWLRFPTSEVQQLSNGDLFADFEGGVLVLHTAADVNNGILAFHSLEFSVSRIQSGETDCALSLCGNNDLYAYLRVSTQNATVFPPAQIAGGDNANVPVPIPGVANSSLTVGAAVDVREEDDDIGPFINPDDHLGVAEGEYTIYNLWGLSASTAFNQCGRDGCSAVTMGMTNSVPYDASDFRGTQFWSFKNFTTDDLGYDIFAAAFTDVEPDESGWFNPFNYVYWRRVTENIAEGGTCFGMALSSIDSSRGRNLYRQPIFSQYFNATRFGPPLTDFISEPAVASLKREIDIKHMYAASLNGLVHQIDAVTSGESTDVTHAWNELVSGSSENVIILTDERIGGKVHAVRPYKVASAVSSCGGGFFPVCDRVYVADPNLPKGASAVDEFIDIAHSGNRFFYREYDGGEINGRIIVQPYSLYEEPQRTPFATLGGTLIGLGKLLIPGNAGVVEQVTDQQGRTVFEPGLSGPPTRWDELRKDAAARTPYLAPVALASGDAANPIQLYAGKMNGATLAMRIVKNPAQTTNEPYEVMFDSERLSFLGELLGTAGKADVFTARNVGTDQQAMSIAVPADSNPKAASWVVAGTDKQRYTRFKDFLIRPGQEITVRVENAGRSVIVENNGAISSGRVVATGAGAANEVDLGSIIAWPGTNTYNVQKPIPEVFFDAQLVGNDGWIRAPFTVWLDAKDLSGTGIQSKEYSYDGQNWTPYNGLFLHNVEGVSTLYYRARDNDGNVSEPKTVEIKLDSRKPAMTASIVPNGLSYSATDATPGSGFKSLTATVTNKDGSTASYSETAVSKTLPLTTAYDHVDLVTEDVAGNRTTNTLRNADYPGLILSHNPVGYWRLNDAPGPVAIDLGSAARNGVYKGRYDDSPLASAVPGALLSDPAPGAFFIISNNPRPPAGFPPTQYNYIEIPPSPEHNVQRVTLEAWANLRRPGTPSTYQSIVMKGTNTFDDGYGLYWYMNQIFFYVNTRLWRVGIPVPDLEAWAGFHHVVATYDGTYARIYLDGAEVGSLYKPNANLASAAPLTIGKGPILGWSGSIDEVALYKEALRLEDIQLHYQRGRAAP
jgi:hypothetical protein